MKKIIEKEVEVNVSEEINFNATKKNLDSLFQKYRSYKLKEDIIRKRTNTSLSLDNLGIYSNSISNPTANKVEQLSRYTEFTDLIDKTYELFCYQLTKDEKIIYKKTLMNKLTDEEVMEELLLNSPKNYYARKKNCYVKVAMWFDLEVYKD